MGVPDPSYCNSNKPGFSPITQTVPEIWPKRWTEYSCCYDNVMKIYKHINKNKDAPDFITVSDQPSHGHSNKLAFSKIAQALPEL